MLTIALLLALAAAPRFAPDDCRSVELRDREGGHVVVGAEDVVFDPPRRRFLVSAHDRLSGAPGGVYALPLPLPPGEVWRVTNLAPGARPHGIALRPEGGFTVIDRAGEGGTQLVTYPLEGPPRIEPMGEAVRLCAANDLAYAPGGEAAITIEREGCGGWSRLIGGRSGSVLSLGAEPDHLAGRLRLANGIAHHGGTFWVAEMRGARLVSVPGGQVIGLDGSPDNINASEEGIVAALQPSLWRFGLYRYGYRDRAPSLVVLVDTSGGEAELLFEDQAGALLAGATAAALGGGHLVAGSVRGERLLVCGAG